MGWVVKEWWDIFKYNFILKNIKLSVNLNEKDIIYLSINFSFGNLKWFSPYNERTERFEGKLKLNLIFYDNANPLSHNAMANYLRNFMGLLNF